jgi:excisionase family DNA binding protein
MNTELVITTRDALQTMILDCMAAALKHHAPAAPTASPAPAADDLLTKAEAAALLSCSRSTIDNAARAGKLRRHYVGKAVRFTRGEVLALARVK